MGVVRAGRIDHKKPSLAERRVGQHGGDLATWSSDQEGSGFLSSMMSKGKTFLAKHPALVEGVKGAVRGIGEDGFKGAVRGGLQGAISKSDNMRRLFKQ